MVVRLHDGMRSVQLAEKGPGPGEQVLKEQFVIFMSALLKGNAEEKSSIVLRMVSAAEGAAKGSQVLEVGRRCSVGCVWGGREGVQRWVRQWAGNQGGGSKNPG